MNFLGLGLNFSSQDKGLKGSITDITAGMTNITKSIVSASVASAKMVLKPPNFGPAVAMAQHLASDVKVTTTWFEAFGVQVDKVTSSTMAGLNLTDKQLKANQREVSRTAFAMNIDIGTVTDSMTALAQSGVKASEVGFKSFQEFQKVMTVTGTDSKQFAATLAGMGNQLEFTGDEIGKLLKHQAALGKKFNRGRESISSFSSSMELLLQHAARFPETFTKADVVSFVQGTEIAAGALMKIGATADEATQTSQKLTEQLLKGQQGVADVLSGVSDNLGIDMKTLLTHFGGSTEKAFELLSKSPDEFIGKIGEVTAQARKMGATDAQLDMFRSQMEQTFGTGVLRAINNYDQLGEHLADGRKEIKLTGDEVTDLAKKQKDGRTAAERFNLIQDRMVTDWKRINGVMSDQEFLKSYKRQTEDLTKTLTKWAGKGGIVGTATKKLIEFRTFGIGGALGAGSEMGLMLSEMFKQFQPILAVLPGIAAAFAALASPVVLVAAAIAGITFAIKDLSSGGDSIIRPFLDRLSTDGPMLLDKLFGWFEESLTKVANLIVEVWSTVDWAAVGDYLGMMFTKIMDWLAKMILNLFSKMLDFVAFFHSLDWTAIGKAVGRGLGKAISWAFGFVYDLVKIALDRLPGLVVSGMQALAKFVWGFVGDLYAEVVDKVSEMLDFFDSDSVGVKDEITAARAAVAQGKTPEQAEKEKAAAHSAAQRSEMEKLNAEAMELTKKGVDDQVDVMIKSVEARGTDVAGMTESIAGINPRHFKRNVRVIEKEFVGFMETMEGTAKNLVNATSKSLDKFWETSQKGWQNQTDLIRRWAADAGVHIQKYWTSSIFESAKAMYEMQKMVTAMFDHLKVLSSTFNIMDILASPDQITQWANMVVAALANAFRSGAHMDAMFSASYQRALQTAVQMQNQAGPATPGVTPSASPIVRDPEARSAAEALSAALNTPSWTQEGIIVDNLKKQTELLQKVHVAISANRTTRPAKTINANTGGVD